jgi:uncharacterized membrane protein YhaH (DUF805 family)
MRLNIAKVIKEEFIEKLFTTKGKTTKLDYIISLIFANLLYAIVSYFTNLWADLFLGLIHALIIYPITIRRLRDIGRTGKTLLWILTIIGILYVIYLLIFKGSVVNAGIDNPVVVNDNKEAYLIPEQKYENEKLYFIISIFVIILVSFISHYSNSISPRSLYLNYSIITPIIFKDAGVKSAEISEIDEDGIVEVSVIHIPMASHERGFLKEMLVQVHCLDDFYKSNALFTLYDAKFMITLSEAVSGYEDVIEVNNEICDLMRDNIADIESQENSAIDSSFELNNQPNY